MDTKNLPLPSKPTNIIYTGVAGTGKTLRLLNIQKRYDEVIKSSRDEWRIQQIANYSWCDVICVVLLIEERMMTVPEIMRHQVIKEKMQANNRFENISQTIWAQLNTHAHPESKTVNNNHRSANYYFDKNEASQWFILDEVKALLNKRLSDLLALYMSRDKIELYSKNVISRSCLVSFHQSYGYEEFVEGIRPRINEQTGQMQYDIQNGAFVELCAKAKADPEHRYAMLIDEINRANTAQVFGELMSVIEPSKRSDSNTPMSVRLAYSGRQFMVPSNVDIYATMNTQDSSLAMLDNAFRRRFEFIDCIPDSSVVGSVVDSFNDVVDMAKMMDVINNRITSLLGYEAQLGQSYFMDVDNIKQLARRLHRQIIPQILNHLNLLTSSTELSQMLFQVLYGRSDINGISQDFIESCILRLAEQNQEVEFSDAHNSQGFAYIGSTNSILNNLASSVNSGFNKAFIQVANSNNLNIEDNALPNGVTTDDYKLFLSAKPYQQLYELN